MADALAADETVGVAVVDDEVVVEGGAVAEPKDDAVADPTAQSKKKPREHQQTSLQQAFNKAKAKAPGAPALPPPPPSPVYKRVGKPGWLDQSAGLARTKPNPSAQHSQADVVKVVVKEQTGKAALAPVFALGIFMVVVTVNGVPLPTLPKTCLCTCCFKLVSSTEPMKHLSRSGCHPVLGAAAVTQIKGTTRQPTENIDPTTGLSVALWPFSKMLPHHIRLATWLVTSMRPFSIAADLKFRDFLLHVSNHKYRPCSPRFILVLLSIITGLVEVAIMRDNLYVI